MDDDEMQLEELGRLKDFARDGMARDMRRESGLPDEMEAPAGEGETDIEMVPGSEDDMGASGSGPEGMAHLEGLEGPGGGAKIPPELLMAILAKLKGGMA